MSELLQQPVLPRRFQKGSQKLEANTATVNKSSDFELDNKSSDSKKLCSRLRSVELVKNIKTKERKAIRDEFTDGGTEKQTAKITKILPLKAKLKSANAKEDKMVDDTTETSTLKASKEDYFDQSLRSAIGSITFQSIEGGYSTFVTHNIL